MATISPKPATGVITRFGPLPDTGTVDPISPKPSTGVITRFAPLGFKPRAHRNLGLSRGARGVG